MPQNEDVTQIVAMAINEDVGSGDVSALIIPELTEATAKVITREPMVLAGSDYFFEVFRQIDPAIKIHWYFQDGNFLNADDEICCLSGKARSLLTGERTALNFMQTLSGTATATYRLASLIKHTQTKLLDTRKTIPCLRIAQKYAVKCGGGENHRIGLYDAFLIKENHIAAAGSITAAVKQARVINSKILLEVEVENLVQLEEALLADVSRILLDNFSLSDIKKAVKITNKQTKLEASGNISENNIEAIAETGVDFISVGKITKDVKTIDLSMRFL